ncbi:MAG: PLP-dependent aminotransferase family protein [Clostridia bacterium]|nr:PLP-dependent aminotransferase family protein [Clostridia bacterium]
MEYNFSNKLASLKPSAIREIFKSLSDPSIISLAAGNPAPESFPVKELAKISADIFENSPVTALQYGLTEGYPPLREAVADRLKNKFSIGRDFDSTVIVTGGQQGIELTCKAFCNEGDTVICENPTFIGALNAFRSNGANTVGVELEDDGINIEKLEETIKNTKNVKLLYLIPTFQNPAGITTSLEKRKKIYEIAKKYRIVVIEDNPYGELRFAGKEIPTIKSMDTEGLVVYCGSFSKILSAGMRVGFMCAPNEIISKAVVAKQVEDVHTNMFFQMLCHRYMTECDLDAHIAGIRDIYRRKCTLMLTELENNMPECVKFTRPEGGLFIWCTLPESIDLGEFVKAAIANKVAVVPGTAFNCDTEAPSNAFRLNYSTPSDEQIVKGVRLLAETVKQFLNK